MSSSTTILGPYDDMSTADKIIVSGAIPLEVKNFLFEVFLPRRGATDKLITRGLYLIEAYLSDESNSFLHELDELAREEVVNNLLNAFVTFLQTLDARTLLPTEGFTPSGVSPNVPGHVKDMI